MREHDDGALELRLRRVLREQLDALPLDLSADILERRRNVRNHARRRRLGLLAMGLAAALLVPLGVLSGEGRPLFVGLLVPSPAISPSSAASVSPNTPPPLTGRFDSALNAISLRYPAGWQTKPATEPWAHDGLAFAASDVDVLFDPALGDEVYIAIVSEPLGGRQPEDWCCSPPGSSDVCEAGSGGHGGSADTLDGAEGFFVTSGCVRHGRRGTSHSIAAASASRGYIVTLFVDPTLAGIYDKEWFTAVLRTVDLQPETVP